MTTIRRPHTGRVTPRAYRDPTGAAPRDQEPIDGVRWAIPAHLMPNANIRSADPDASIRATWPQA